MKLVEPSALLISSTPHVEKLIEYAARTCYKSEGLIEEGSAQRIISKVIASGHDSVLEHVSATFQIITDRSTSHQIVRHRIGMSYSQESQRFCNYSKDKFDNSVTFILPQDIKNDFEREFILESYLSAEQNYFNLLDNNIPPQRARFVLPNGTKTEITMTGNFRAWRHFLKLRLDTHAQIDIRILAQQIQKQLEGISSTVFSLESLEK